MKLEFINERTIENAVDTYDLSGLIPKTIHFDSTVQFQLGGTLINYFILIKIKKKNEWQTQI
mgnify:CR=1 FL=1